MISSRIVLRTARILTVACMIVSGVASLAVAREWTDNTGKYHVEAEFVQVVGETVRLRKSDGREIAVALARLNEESRLAVAAAIHATVEQPNAVPLARPIETVDRSVPSPLSSNANIANSKSLAKIVAVQKEVLRERIHERLAQASQIWNVAAELLDEQSAAVSKWNAGRQKPLALSIGPAEAIKTAVNGLAAHHPRALWDGLPLAYQQDLHAILHDYAGQMDPDVWQAGRQVLQKAILVSRAQQKFLLNYPLIREALEESSTNQPTSAVLASGRQTDENSAFAWEASVDVLELLADSDLADLKQLSTLDVGLFLDQTGVEIMQQLARASRKTADDSFNQGLLLISSMQVSQVSMVGAEAMILLTSGEQSELNSMVLVDGNWIPAELARAWPGLMSTGRAGLVVLADKSFSQRKPEWIRQLQATEKALDDLLTAQTQAEFDALLDGLLVAVSEE